ncbi:efflux RND transporter periplasmic adaptor subunit [Oscillospiraceae bacterium N12]|jgi:RND family efflux transporter MFP subunit|uniref:Efflux RND transporter periplasmic adaptor subunit n=1 Tax=Jilunia laotingensis TaxID=2763675 RepID=A0A926F4A2_9BACT|nr:efflux RND transporter periplasmic adaptor subunit [Jilunia laotingensis]MBC8594416.1 efflux RND transporter periplasmic adaptor subunit [Jilunia laotingensis]
MKKLMYILLVLPLLTGCGNKKEATGRTMPIPEISVAKPIIKDIVLTQDYPGYLTAEQTVDLVARVNGTLQATSFSPGSKVKKGQLLFIIEPTIYKDNVTQAEAALKTAQAQLTYARNNYTRMREALKSDAVSRIQVLQAESAVAEETAAVSNAEAALNTARTNLGYCYIRAPFDGTVSRNTVDIGSYISAAIQPVTLATLYKDNKMYTYFNVADNQWLAMLMSNNLRTGVNNEMSQLPKNVTVKLGKDGSQTYPGTLDYLSPNVDINTGTLTIRANLENPDGLLKSGLYVSITLPYGEQKQALLVNSASIGTDQLGRYLYVVNDSDIVNYRHVTVGQLIEDTLQQITSGLSPQERYVTKALMKVRDGMKIHPSSK